MNENNNDRPTIMKVDKKELLITTTDVNFIKDLKSENIPGLEVNRIYSAVASLDPQITSNAIDIVIFTTSTVSLNLFSNWLYDRMKKDTGHITTLNQQNIVNNIGQINVIINNYIESK
jgi:hypothetical protein